MDTRDSNRFGRDARPVPFGDERGGRETSVRAVRAVILMEGDAEAGASPADRPTIDSTAAWSAARPEPELSARRDDFVEPAVLPAGRVEPQLAAPAAAEVVEPILLGAGPRPVEPIIAAGGGDGAIPPAGKAARKVAPKPPSRGRWKLYAAGLLAAVAIGGIAGAWATVNGVRQPPAKTAAVVHPAGGIATASLGAAPAKPAATAEEVAQLEHKLAAIGDRLAAIESRVGKPNNEVGERLERFEKDQGKRLAALTERLDKLAAQPVTEARAATPAPAAAAPVTASADQHPLVLTAPLGGQAGNDDAGPPINVGQPTAPALPTARPQALARADMVPVQPRGTGLIRDWAVRDVYRGVATLEGRYGVVEAAQGDYVPGLGRVISIGRQGREWGVMTDAGLIVGAAYDR
jgi:hypothetical protein